MINVILEFILLNGVESILFMFMCLGFNFKSLARDRLFLTWFLLACIIYFVPILLFSIPILTQIISIGLSSFVLSTFFNLKFSKCCTDLTILIFLIMLSCEAFWYILFNLIIGIDIYTTLIPIHRFLYALPIRIIEIILIFIIGGGHMKMWFMGLFAPKKETEKKDTEKK